MKIQWIDGQGNETVGQLGFLVEISNAIKGSERYELRDRPPYTNQSHEPRPLGWCGTYNDVAAYGLGVYRVVKIARNGRVRVEEVVDRETLGPWLEEVGYPELLEECIPCAEYLAKK